MSLRKLQSALQSLSFQPSIDAGNINHLRDAAGPKVSQEERAAMDAFVRSNAARFSSDAIVALQRDFAMQPPQAAELAIVATSTMKIQEASGVAALGEGQFLIADDESGLFLCDGEGKGHLLLSGKEYPELRGLEGITMSTDGSTAYVVSEDSRRVYSIGIGHSDDGSVEVSEPQELGRLPKLSKHDNKGWEGISILPGAFSSDGEDKLVAVNEGRPRTIGIFSLPSCEEEQLIPLPDTFEDQLHDLSDVAICPKTGHLFLLSDESSAIAEVEFSTKHRAGPGALLPKSTLQLLQIFALPPGQKSEGICFNGEGSLWVTSELDRSLTELRVDR